LIPQTTAQTASLGAVGADAAAQKGSRFVGVAWVTDKRNINKLRDMLTLEYPATLTRHARDAN